MEGNLLGQKKKAGSRQTAREGAEEKTSFDQPHGFVTASKSDWIIVRLVRAPAMPIGCAHCRSELGGNGAQLYCSRKKKKICAGGFRKVEDDQATNRNSTAER